MPLLINTDNPIHNLRVKGWFRMTRMMDKIKHNQGFDQTQDHLQSEVRHLPEILKGMRYAIQNADVVCREAHEEIHMLEGMLACAYYYSTGVHSYFSHPSTRANPSHSPTFQELLNMVMES